MFQLSALVAASLLCTIHGFTQLGKHRNPAKGVTVLGGKFPPPTVFFHHFMKGSEPLHMSGVLNETNYPAFNKWTDDYLREYYGDELMRVELTKKERRGEERLLIRVSRFLEVYQERDMYLIHALPPAMHDEVMVPFSLRCAGLRDSIHEAVMWMSSGNTDSVLHYDDMHNINCLLDGEKRFVLYDPAYKSMIEDRDWVENGSYSQIDPTNVDPAVHNKLFNAPWYQLNMKKGDCAFIPKRWYHYIHSPGGRNLAVNLWFSHLYWLNQTGCVEMERANEPLSNFTFASPNQQIRAEVFSPFSAYKEILEKKFVAESWCPDKSDAKKIFSLLNKNKDNHLTWEEMYSVDIDELVTAFPHCFIRPEKPKTKQPSNVPKPAGSPHQVSETPETPVQPPISTTTDTSAPGSTDNDQQSQPDSHIPPTQTQSHDRTMAEDSAVKDTVIDSAREVVTDTSIHAHADNSDDNRSDPESDNKVNHDEF